MDTSKKGSEDLSIKGIYHVHTSGLFQRGFRIFKQSGKEIALSPRNALTSVFVSNGKDNLSIPIKSKLVASINKSGPSGTIGNLANSKEAILYLISKKSGINPALILVSSGEELKLPESYEFISEPLWYVSIVKSNKSGGNIIVNFIDMGNGINYYYKKIYREKDKVALHHFSNLREIKRIFTRAPMWARFIILDVTLVLKNQSKRGFFEIVLDRGSDHMPIERIMLSPTKEERIYRISVKVPVLNKRGEKSPSIIKAQVSGLSSLKSSDAYAYIYLKGWKAVDQF